jgi:hypothetical protein
MTVHEVPSGTGVLDWTVPKEWNVRDAYVADAAGQRVVDVSASNLHLVSYSVPVRQQVSLVKLQEHLFTDAAKWELGSRLAEAARESHSMDRGVAAYAETYRRALARRLR